MQNIGDCARSRAKYHRTTYTVHGLKNDTVFSECARAHFPDYLNFMHNTGCAVQN